MSEYRPDKIESYWQNIWSEKDSFKPRPVSENKPKIYFRDVSISIRKYSYGTC
ncbi:MAG: hypothetical protein CM15mP109_03530 [Candidatus Dadabacteria bacterium]|nr:MAG: hypothetical protein CM15mP109_03530 [Candidatus Dadabacteria bacterium]